MARIPQSEIDRIKREVDLLALMQSKGLVFEKHGSNDQKTLCPFHPEKSASLIVTPSENLWHCMGGCGKGGSVYDFVMKYEGVSFRHAHEILSQGEAKHLLRAGPPIKHSRKPKLESPVNFEADDYAVTAQVVNYYQKKLKETPLALEYLEKRGITPEAIEKFEIGYSDRTLGLTLPSKQTKAGKEMRGRLTKIGLFREETGHEHFNGCVTFPIKSQREVGPSVVTEIYGRKVYDNLRPGTLYHLYLPGDHVGIFNEEALASSREIILCESVIDALTFWCAGYKNVTCIYGTQGFKDELFEAFLKYKTERVYLAYDRDESGNQAAERDIKRLREVGIEVYRVMFPQGMDANEYARKVTPAEKSLGLLLRSAEWMGLGKRNRSEAQKSESLKDQKLEAELVAPKPVEPPPVLETPPPVIQGPPPSPETPSPSVMEPPSNLETPLPVEKAPPPVPVSPSPSSSLLLAAKEKEEALPMVPKLVEESGAQSSSSLVALELAAHPEAEERQAAKDQRDAGPSKEATKEKRQDDAGPDNGCNVTLPKEKSQEALPIEQTASYSPPPLVKSPPPDLVSPPPITIAPPPVPKTPPSSRCLEKRGDAWYMSLDEREYRVSGLEKTLGADHLKITLRLTSHRAGGDDVHLDQVDLVRDVERRRFIERAAEETGLTQELLKRDLGKLLLAVEQAQMELLKPVDKASAEVALNPEERAEALNWLRGPNLIERLKEAFHASGIVGEETNTLVAYLAGVSRKLDRPLAIIIQSASAAGKSTLMDAVLSFFPEEERIKYSAMTGQSLYYLGETNLKHKILAVVEEAGAEKATYALKLLQSEGYLTIASTGKDPQTGRMVTQEYRVEGPVVIFLTTTAIDIDEELLNRFFVLTVNESQEQTERIHRLQRERRTLAGLIAREQRQDILQVLRNVQRLLHPIPVLNAYAPQLTFPSGRTRNRRDHEKYLTLIDAIALLHQHQRPRGHYTVKGQVREYIAVTLEDIALANQLAGEVLARSLDELPPQTRRILDHIRASVTLDPVSKPLASAKRPLFTRRQLREKCGWSLTQVRVHLDRLVELEYLYLRAGRMGGPFEYELVIDGQAEVTTDHIGLINVETLRETQQPELFPLHIYQDNASGVADLSKKVAGL
jgi:DNA primase catalytic core